MNKEKFKEFEIKWNIEPFEKWEDNNLNYKDRIRFKNEKWYFWIRFKDIDEMLEILNDIKKIIENGEFDNE